jgi:hypothetical protein
MSFVEKWITQRGFPVEKKSTFFIHIQVSPDARDINMFSTGKTSSYEPFSAFSTGSTPYNKKSDKIYSIDYNRPAKTRRFPA